jgi:pilus assembly protein CpaB
MRRPVIFVLLAGFAALVAALVVYSALKKREAEVQQALVKSVNIVVAARDLSIGSKLDASSVKLVRWSRDSMPPGAFTDSASLMNQYTRSNFVQNEPIVADRLFSGEKNAGMLPLLIPNGMRAVSVPVDEVSDVAGFVLPHARVDVLVALAGGGAGDKPFSKIVLQNVEVLAIAQDIEIQGTDKAVPVKVITLLVTPEEAERLTLATREGTLRLAMRNYEDTKVVMTSGVDVAQMLRSYGGPQPGVPMMEPQHVGAVSAAGHGARVRPVEVEILRNGKSSENVSFIRSDGSMQRSPKSEPSGGPSAADNPEKISVATGGPVAHGDGGARASARVVADGHAMAALESEVPVLRTAGPASSGAPRPKTIDVP